MITQTDLTLLELETIEDFFYFLLDLYGKEDKKLALFFINQLSDEQKKEAVGFLDAALWYEKWDAGDKGQEEFDEFIALFRVPVTTKEQVIELLLSHEDYKLDIKEILSMWLDDADRLKSWIDHFNGSDMKDH